AAQRADVAAVEGELLFELGRVEEAQAALALALVDEAPSDAKISALTMTGQIHAMSGRLPEAEVVLHESIALIERDAGPEHPDLARPLNLLGVVQIQRGELRLAVATLERARDICSAQLGADHPMVAHVIGNLALAQGDLGDREGAYQSLLRVKASFERADAVNEPQLAATLGNLAKQALAAGRPNEALGHAAEATRLDLELGKPIEVSGAVSITAKARRQLGDLPGALRSFEELLALHHEHQPDNHDKLGWAELAIAELSQQLGREPLAAEHLERALEHYTQSTDTSPGERARAERIAARLRAGDRERAADHLRRAWTLLEQDDADIGHDIRDLGERMALVETWLELGGPELMAWPRIVA
ncbi:MAG: tetratricopeptide repeat protein, partial [Myxococcales bacterium]|nr:tetratricopeptide repeat protein [Myxococcales bacterium]